MIIVIDYKVGNVQSVCNAFGKLGIEAKLSRKAADIRSASGLILPGVAAFGYAMSELGDAAELVKEAALQGTPLLGICVGYQLLFDQSCEHGQHQGLGLISGSIVNIPAGRTIPHMGWNLVELPGDMNLFAGLDCAKHFYFAHSYYSKIDDPETKVAYADYGFDLPASVQKKNIYGTQFHPEKSGSQGLQVLRNFYNICERKN